ncbi:3-methyladenine DNA glycosylase AlkD [Nakamurella panacisegetis]|uniref:3-methyladenine DNA glycosylase AlkD n=1 Tax=Nakamurella panacisegetis TaxID=1090615 RepID=A0A1H0HJP4_9ACTN|nr:DNA alkylation repair protein [Nakamurella panacisegetis]SDO19415.1 3-methyladenine DNA glycosylase AlkD [Nakamurella panacisegetis]
MDESDDFCPSRPTTMKLIHAAPGRADVTALVEDVRSTMRAQADQSCAPGMQAYMKSAMPFLGVPVPQVRAIVTERLRQEPAMTVEQLRDAAVTLWREAEFREERYAATALTRARPARGVLELLPLYQEMIVTGAWWDHVDEIARRIGELLVAHPAQIRPVLIEWSTAPDQWLRRAAILGQLGLRSATDLDLLAAVIEPNMGDREFFIRKAIGWALRDYARTDPAWVGDFVARHRAEMQPLSIREALKNVHG